MSFSKTVSVCAALASIFAAGTAGFKLAQDSQNSDTQNVQTKYEERIIELQQQVSGLQQQLVNTSPPAPTALPKPQEDNQTPPTPPTLPPVPSEPPSQQPPTP